jgi:hypothetical protein
MAKKRSELPWLPYPRENSVLIINSHNFGGLFDDQVAYWPLDEGTGTTTGDPAGELKGGATWSADTAPTSFSNPFSISFNGSSGWVDFGNIFNFGSQSFSVGLWFKASASLSTAPPGARLLQKRGTGGFGVPGWAIHVRRAVSDVRLSNFVIDTGDARVGSFLVAESPPRDAEAFVIGQVSEWIHFGFSLNKATSRLRLYVDGSMVRDYDTSAKTLGSVDNSRSLTLGASDISLTQFFNGLIDDVRLFDGVLQPSGFSALAAGGP